MEFKFLKNINHKKTSEIALYLAYSIMIEGIKKLGLVKSK